MTQYLVRTNSEQRKTHILRVGDPAETIGIIYTDFNLKPDNRDISEEDIIDPSRKNTIAKIQLYKNGNIISIRQKKEEFSSYTQDGEYMENRITIPLRKMPKDILLSREEFRALEEMGLTHAYFLGNQFNLSQVFCFEKEGDISGIIHTKEPDDTSALMGVTLTLAQRIEDQKFVFEFIKA